MRSSSLLFCGLLIVLCFSPRLQARPSGSEDSEGAPSSGDKTRGFGSLVVVAGDKEWAMAARILVEVNRVGGVPKARAVFVEAGFPQEPPPEELMGYLKRIRAGRKHIFQLNLPPAIKRLESVIAELHAAIRKHGGTPGLLRRLMQGYSYLGAAHQLNADTTASERAFATMLSIEPGRGLSPKFFSPEVIEAFNRIREGLTTSGALRIQTDHPALVLVNGRLMGIAPTVVKGLHVGDHVVEIRRLGMARVTRIVTVEGQAPTTITVRLSPNAEQAHLRKALENADRELRRSAEPGPAMAALAKALDVRHVVACRASLDDGEASWFDATGGKYVKRVRRLSAVPGSPAVAVIAKAMTVPSPAIDLQAGSASAGGACETSKDCPSGTCVSGRCVSDVPIYKKWWFWTLIGLGVAAVAGGTTGLVLAPERPVLRISLGER